MPAHLSPRTLPPLALLLLVSACGGEGDDATAAPLPRLSAATGATLQSCATLAGSFTHADTTIASAAEVSAGTLTIGGRAIGAHCLVKGEMHRRTSAIDGQSYAIGFELRLPQAWNGRFFHQANGGLDGSVLTATGPSGGGGPVGNALDMGFAVISSDAGHASAQNGTPNPFGLDFQARLDYGYQAVGKLTPMAKQLIASAYGKGPDRSYIGGCSNGGRHAMVAASRYADQYDGFLIGNPGYRLPRAAIANIAGAQKYDTLATTAGDLGSGFTLAERQLVSAAVLSRCDALDGAADGLVQDTQACQSAFSLARDVPTCTTGRDGSCLSAQQKSTLAELFSGVKTAAGTLVYSSFPYDAGLATTGWSSWKFTAPMQRDAGAVAFVWQVPPASATGFDGSSFALTGDVADMLARVAATSSVYTESALSFMLPPDATDLSALRRRGAKVMAYHGTSDPIFSSDDTGAWYDGLKARHGGDASDFARLFMVPGMNHCSGGPATDQFDMITPLVNWVEQGTAPDSVTGTARGSGNAGGVNADLPSTWSAGRTRPLCPYPKVARLKSGATDLESAASFSCQ
ncbi:feruloyl esterase [Sphaerotilus hippei]|uniref:Feruloyl esterase n=1 Tax=Sphaerotilus hippei TaxID=744406 RepID=A0A318H5Z1_9BURK|nr:tannase/feruloyl esterase family alpha/beta hydrolase [Sphaerotilus hippei]PXW97661.1 feruloyl esterase [Sphaerotilus hippei]